MYSTIDDLREHLGGKGAASLSPEYRAKMLHELPKATTVDRVKFILQHCADKRVIEFGASGPLTEEIRKTAAAYMGVDRTEADDVIAFDLDDILQQSLPHFSNAQIIVCGEVLEHLSNPGHFLTRLRRLYGSTPLIVTVPNAYSDVGRQWLQKGIENVNADHVAWYSPRTLSVLLQRAGYEVGQLFYYNGTGPKAEGLIVTAE